MQPKFSDKPHSVVDIFGNKCQIYTSAIALALKNKLDPTLKELLTMQLAVNKRLSDFTGEDMPHIAAIKNFPPNFHTCSRQTNGDKTYLHKQDPVRQALRQQCNNRRSLDFLSDVLDRRYANKGAYDGPQTLDKHPIFIWENELNLSGPQQTANLESNSQAATKILHLLCAFIRKKNKICGPRDSWILYTPETHILSKTPYDIALSAEQCFTTSAQTLSTCLNEPIHAVTLHREREQREKYKVNIPLLNKQDSLDSIEGEGPLRSVNKILITSQKQGDPSTRNLLDEEESFQINYAGTQQDFKNNIDVKDCLELTKGHARLVLDCDLGKNSHFLTSSDRTSDQIDTKDYSFQRQWRSIEEELDMLNGKTSRISNLYNMTNKTYTPDYNNRSKSTAVLNQDGTLNAITTTMIEQDLERFQASNKAVTDKARILNTDPGTQDANSKKKSSTNDHPLLDAIRTVAHSCSNPRQLEDLKKTKEKTIINIGGNAKQFSRSGLVGQLNESSIDAKIINLERQPPGKLTNIIEETSEGVCFLENYSIVKSQNSPNYYLLHKEKYQKRTFYNMYPLERPKKGTSQELDIPQHSQGVDSTHAADFVRKNTFKTYSASSTQLDKFGNTQKPVSHTFDFSESIAQTNDSIYYTADFILALAAIKDYHSEDVKVFGAYNIYNAEVRDPEHFLANADGQHTLRYSSEVKNGSDWITCAVLENGRFNTTYHHKAAQEYTGENRKFYASNFSTSSKENIHRSVYKATKQSKRLMTTSVDQQLEPISINGRQADFALIERKNRMMKDLDSTDDAIKEEDKLIVRTVVFEARIETKHDFLKTKSDYTYSTKLSATNAQYMDLVSFEKATSNKQSSLSTINSNVSLQISSKILGEAEQITNTVKQTWESVLQMEGRRKNTTRSKLQTLESSRLKNTKFWKTMIDSAPRDWLEPQGDNCNFRNFFFNSQSLYKMDTSLPIHADDYNFVIELIFKIEVCNYIYTPAQQNVQKERLKDFYQPNISSKELPEISHDITPHSISTIERMIEIYSVTCLPNIKGALRKRYQQRSGIKVTYQDQRDFNFFEKDWNDAQHSQDLIQTNLGYVTTKEKQQVQQNGSNEKIQDAYHSGRLDKFSVALKTQMHNVSLAEKNYQKTIEANRPVIPQDAVYHGLAHTKIGEILVIREQKQPNEIYEDIEKQLVEVEPIVPSRVNEQFELISLKKTSPQKDEIANYNDQLHTLLRIENNQNHMFAHAIQKLIAVQESEGILKSDRINYRNDQLKQMMTNIQEETPVYGGKYNTFIKDIHQFTKFLYEKKKNNHVKTQKWETLWMSKQTKENKVQVLDYPYKKDDFFKIQKKPQFIEDYSCALMDYCKSLQNNDLIKEFFKIYDKGKYSEHKHYVEWLSNRKHKLSFFNKVDMKQKLEMAKQNESILKEKYGDKIQTGISVIEEFTQIISQDDFDISPQEEHIIRENRWYAGKKKELDIIEELFEDDPDEDDEQKKLYEVYKDLNKKNKATKKKTYIIQKDPDALQKFENKFKRQLNTQGITQGRKEQTEQSKEGLNQYYSDFDRYKDENPSQDKAKMESSNLKSIGDRADALLKPFKNRKSRARFYQPFHEAQLTQNQQELRDNVISAREKRKADRQVKDNPSPKMIEVTEEYWVKRIRNRRPKPMQYQSNGQQPPGVRFNDKNAVEAQNALEKRLGCAQVKPEDKWQNKAFSVVSTYLKEIIYDKGIHAKIQSRYNLQDYINEVKSKDPNKGERLQKCLEISKKHKIRGLKSQIDFFQKNPLQEPKTKGQVVKPRGIANNKTCIKSKKVRRNLNKKDKKAYESYYNLYCNYISHVFIDCIKKGQSEVDSGVSQKATFTHGLNTKQLTNDFLKNYEEMTNISGGQEIAYHSSDFGKFDAFRSKKTLINFDNKQLAEFMSNVKDLQPSAGFYPVDYQNTQDLQFQTDLDVTHKDSFQRIQFTARIQGTVPSGFGPRTTLGNTLFNMAYQQQLTRGLYSRSFAAGDDGAFIILKKDVPQIKERVKELTSDNNSPKNDKEAEHGLGLLIDDTLNFDSELITFQSKIIDIKAYATARLLEKVAATGCITGSKVDMKVINYCNNKQQEEYFSLPFYNGIERVRSGQEQVSFLKEPDWNSDYVDVKREIESSQGKNCKEQNPNFIKEFNYKKDARPTAAPVNYLKRISDATGGQRFTHNVEMDELVGSLLTNINQSNQN